MARIAIVTGSESGIGRAVAVALAEQGCDVGITWYRDRDAGEATAEEVSALGRRAEVRYLDLTQLPDAAAVVDELADALGGSTSWSTTPGRGTRPRFSTWISSPGGRYWPPTSTVRSSACSARRGGWSPPAAVGGSSTSRACTSTCPWWARRRTAPRRAASACSRRWRRSSSPSTGSR